MNMIHYDGLSVARELHDSVLQELIVTVMQLRDAVRTDDSEKRLALIGTALEAARQSIEQTRELIRGLRGQDQHEVLQKPVCVREQISEIFERTRKISDLEMDVFADESFYVEPATGFHIAKIVHEAVMNTVRHSEAHRVTCSIRKIGKNGIHIRIDDDGKGYPLETQAYGLGILGMRERAALIGAKLNITSASQQGSAISLTVPLSHGHTSSSSQRRAEISKPRSLLTLRRLAGIFAPLKEPAIS